MCSNVGNSPLVPGTQYCTQNLSYSRKFNILADHLSRLDRPLNTEWSLDQLVANSIFQMLNFPKVDLFATRFNHKLPLYVSPVADIQKKVREKSRECHNHKPQPFPDTRRKRKPANPNKHKSNKCTKSTKISSLFPKQGNRNTIRTEKYKNKMTQGKT